MAGSMAMATPFAMRNKIINGAMEIDQRNAGASVSLGGGKAYPVDRFWGVQITDGTMTAQRSSTAPAGFINSVVLTTGTADSSLSATQFACFSQDIEGLNAADLAWGTASAKTITLSFWVRSSLTGTFGGSLRNDGSTRSYPFSYTINSANTFEYKTVTIPGDTSGTWLTTNGLGIGVIFGLGVGSTYSGPAGSWAATNYLAPTGAVSVIGTAGATWYITGVQLEVGTVATPFERRLYTTELQLCQRYYSVQSVYSSLAALSGAVTTPVKYPVSMRASPTVSGSVTAQSGNAGGWPTLNGQDLNGGYVAMNPSGANTTITSTVNFIASIEL